MDSTPKLKYVNKMTNIILTYINIALLLQTNGSTLITSWYGTFTSFGESISFPEHVIIGSLWTQWVFVMSICYWFILYVNPRLLLSILNIRFFKEEHNREIYGCLLFTLLCSLISKELFLRNKGNFLKFYLHIFLKEYFFNREKY